MDTAITSRQSICEDADAAAQRFVATGVEQPNTFTGEAGEAVWLAHYTRMCAYYIDPAAEASA